MKITLSTSSGTVNLRGTVTLTATVNPVAKATRVEFYVDGVLKATDTSSPFTYAWDTTLVSDGSHSLRGRVHYYRNQVQDSILNVSVMNAVVEPPPPPPPPIQAPPVNTTLPVISDLTPQEGQTLTLSLGSWTNNPTSYARQWNRYDAAGTTFVALIQSATGASYTVTADDVGLTLRCWTTAYNTAGASQPVLSAATSVVSALAPAVPVNTAVPVITGTPAFGQTLAISNGGWTNSPTSYTRQWLRCDTSGEACASPAGATNPTYTLTSADVGKTIRCWTTAINGSGSSDPIRSAATAIVTEPPVEGWAFSANEGSACVFSGTKEIRYGGSGVFTAPQVLPSGTMCTNAVFGDPIPGVSKHCEIRDYAGPAPPPPGTGTPLEHFSDFANNAWAGNDIFINRWYHAPGGNEWSNPSATGPNWTEWSGPAITEVSTIHGSGFRFRTYNAMVMGSRTDVQLGLIADFNHLVPDVQIPGLVQDWSGKFILPASGNTSGFPVLHRGLIWEWHTATMSGNHIAIDDNGRLRIGVVNPATQWYDFFLDPNALQLDHWYTWRIQLKWGYDSSCFFKGWLDGVLLADVPNRGTLVFGEKPYLQFGFYSGNGVHKNECIHAAIRKS